MKLVAAIMILTSLVTSAKGKVKTAKSEDSRALQCWLWASKQGYQFSNIDANGTAVFAKTVEIGSSIKYGVVHQLLVNPDGSMSKSELTVDCEANTSAFLLVATIDDHGILTEVKADPIRITILPLSVGWDVTAKACPDRK